MNKRKEVQNIYKSFLEDASSKLEDILYFSVVLYDRTFPFGYNIVSFNKVFELFQTYGSFVDYILTTKEKFNFISNDLLKFLTLIKEFKIYIEEHSINPKEHPSYDNMVLGNPPKPARYWYVSEKCAELDEINKEQEIFIKEKLPRLYDLILILNHNIKENSYLRKR